MQSVIPQSIQDINTLLSILGFIITLYIFFAVKNIKNGFLSRARLPELIKDLEGTGSNLNTCLGQTTIDRDQVLCQLKIACTLIKSALEMLPKIEKKEILKTHKKLIKTVQQYSQQPYHNEKSKFWDLYSDIQSSITSMKQVSKNLKWE